MAEAQAAEARATEARLAAVRAAEARAAEERAAKARAAEMRAAEARAAEVEAAKARAVEAQAAEARAVEAEAAEAEARMVEAEAAEQVPTPALALAHARLRPHTLASAVLGTPRGQSPASKARSATGLELYGLCTLTLGRHVPRSWRRSTSTSGARSWRG